VQEESPRFAPDGRSIGFADGNGIWLLHPNGARTLLVSQGNAFAWSHDGNTLAYLVPNPGTEGEGFDLYLRSGSDPPRRISQNVDFAPTWSPDDRFVAFTYSTYGSDSVSLVEISDLAGNVRDLVQDSTQPDWRP
jgi:Tol biopolymer transport system component